MADTQEKQPKQKKEKKEKKAAPETQAQEAPSGEPAPRARLLDHYEQKVRGKVLLMSSVRGRHGNISGYTGYCASKGATDSLTRVLATEWAKYRITVNAIAPTVFRSKLTAWMYGDNELGQQTRARSLARIPLGRLGEVEDLVGMAIYLLSPASDFCTGQVMYVDGGYTAG